MSSVCADKSAAGRLFAGKLLAELGDVFGAPVGNQVNMSSALEAASR